MTQLAGLDPVSAVAWVVGLALLAGGVTALVAGGYRWYTRTPIPRSLALLAGLTVVAVSLNTTTALGQVIGGARGPLTVPAALANIAAFLVSAVAALAGRRLGHRAVVGTGLVAGAEVLDTGVGRLVRAVGRVIAVTLPEEVEDIEGYDPVPEATKTDLAGRTFVFPRGLTVPELRDRLVTRLKTDHGVGHVDVDLDEDGTVQHLGVGSRAAGLGPTLPPGTAAVAVRADPPAGASSGDVVQVWTAGEAPERVATAEVRGAGEDVVTLALDEAEATALDHRARYRLVTLPAEPRAEREFAGLLRAADETMGVVTVAEGSPLAGTPVGALEPTAVAIRRAAGELEAIPGRTSLLAPGDTLYAIARPEALRRLEAAAQAERSLSPRG